jgi:hypothetical protein
MWLYFFVVYFFVFSVCEGSLGLSILVSIIRSHGNDYFQSYRVNWCTATDDALGSAVLSSTLKGL